MDNPNETTSQPISRTWTHAGHYAYCLVGYMLQQSIKKHATEECAVDLDRLESFQLPSGEEVSIITDGVVSYAIDGGIINYKADMNHGGGGSHIVRGSQRMAGFLSSLNRSARQLNPLRSQFLQLTNATGHGHMHIGANFKELPAIDPEDVVIDEVMKEDIFDNSILTLTRLQESNGIIFHGSPGTGKSLMAALVARKAIEQGIAVCLVIERLCFTDLEAFLDEFVAPCVLILEDIDAFAMKRDNHSTSYLSEFLQFMSGVYQRKKPVAVIATTNYLKHLDEAVRNRPVRFNRLYEFAAPDEAALRKLLGLVFQQEIISDAVVQQCLDAGFTGAHVKELYRTWRLLCEKGPCPHHALNTALARVGGTFATTRKISLSAQ